MSKTIVTGVIGSDAHTIGNNILAYSLEEAGFKVIKLGVLVSQQEFIDAAIETKADAILISSLYGMGVFDCSGFRDRCKEAGLDILLYVGGHLCGEDSGREWEETEKKFKAMGFDRVYPPNTLPDTAIADLEQDLAARK